MLQLPQRRQFASRDEFAAAVSAAFEQLYGLYQTEAVSHTSPEWANDVGAYSIAMPLKLALDEEAAPYGISSLIKHAIEMKKAVICRLARVERDGRWIVFFEAK